MFCCVNNQVGVVEDVAQTVLGKTQRNSFERVGDKGSVSCQLVQLFILAKYKEQRSIGSTSGCQPIGKNYIFKKP